MGWGTPARRGALILFGLAIGLALLETALQAGALVVRPRHESRRERAEREGAPNERTVLCVGDSFTYGLGATSFDDAYPEQLERVLKEAGGRDGAAKLSWRVVNRGWPGRNSAEVLQRMPGFLARERPHYVLILIGTNNSWSRRDVELPPPRLGQTVSSRNGRENEWRWELRTPRLLAIAWLAMTNGRDGGAEDARYRDSGPGADGELNADGAGRIGTRAARSAGTAHERLRRAKRDRAHLRETLEEIDRLVRKERDSIDVAEISRLVDDLRPAVRAVDDEATAHLLLRALSNLERFDAVVEEGSLVIERYGRSVEACGRLVVPLARTGRFDEALSWANEAIRLLPPGSEEPWLYRARAYVYRRTGKLEDYIRDSVRAFALDSNEQTLARALRKIRHRSGVLLDRELKEAAVTAELSLQPEVRERAHAVFRDVVREATTAGEPAWQRRLEDDLKHMVALVKASGARPVLLTYPYAARSREVSAVMHRTADETGAELVDLGAVFQAFLDGNAKRDYFIADGHPNDRGYRVMAQHVAKVLAALESR